MIYRYHNKILIHEYFIVGTFFVYLFSFPFFFRNYVGMVYPLVLNGILLLTFVISVLSSARLNLQWKHQIPGAVWLGIALYFIYFLVLMVASAANYYEPIIAVSAIYEIRDLIFMLSIALLLTDNGLLIALRTYVNLLTWFSVLGLFLIALIYFGLARPIETVNLDNMSGARESIRLFYGIGYVWPESWVGSSYGLERLQSFSDEAGTFAFAVLPAIFLAKHWKMKYKVAILITALFFTFSIGAIIIFLIIEGISAIRSFGIGRTGTKRVINLTGFLIILLTSLNLISISNQPMLSQYVSSKYEINGRQETSIGNRLVALNALVPLVDSNPWGFGSNAVSTSVNLAGGDLAIGWFIPVIEAGVLGWFMYLAAFCLILMNALRNYIATSDIRSVCSVIILVNGYAAFQRSGIDANVWQLFWLVVYLRTIGLGQKAASHFSLDVIRPVNYLIQRNK
ncbi:hypothetical protein E4T66_06845 [Sinimarinibacterium sp. CAU 1509]|uniref:hypothetical protein n=1 Tax=Sinimarinibacterium sp. CAU 1509 TaxID=2562283 RepID=UPI0010AD39AB|nr:hypothetical protein [Sinimarinibacterium sp. CAU 1509]TJY61956.1 hypothetical protein E4T66_06845 [Sinimarinibacterium sp. CAU 1509]